MHLAWLEAIAYSDNVTESGELLARTRREQEKNHGGRAVVEVAALRGRQRDFDDRGQVERRLHVDRPPKSGGLR
ncbi:uncharacterized protein TrAtP1_012373 [Trichoderma atroviride]|uniref:uncharacterized protein n=1 Tax=Hypocrea atroviridis TaxID=63577 RepID=UPI00331C2747|nr:hypothetical protein TrAtP1_012373 [Trichoderma atroviride]